MRVLLISHPVFLLHRSEEWHPERPERLTAAIEGVHASNGEVLDISAEPASDEVLEGVHPEDYVRAIKSFCSAGGGHLDADTYASADSWEAAVRSAGAGPQAIAALLDGQADCAFLAIRPPGHHALASQAMGFCLFNNVAIAAKLLADQRNRVAIIDWDIHHGNGTQDLFNADPRVLYISAHQFPFYPGSGWVDEAGYGPGEGTTINIPFPGFTGGDAYEVAFERIVEPILRQFEPAWILVSSGYDAHEDDPLADGVLRAGDYQALAKRVSLLAPHSRTIFFLEGGYNLEAIRASVTATINGALGEDPPPYRQVQSQASAERIIELVARSAGRFWEIG